MINLEQQIEQDLKTAFQAALTAESITGVSFRCFWVDDSIGSKKEAISFPCIELKASPSGPAESTGFQSPFRELSVECSIYTHHAEDRKRELLSNLWQIIDHSIYNDSIASGSSDIESIEIWRPEPGDCGIEDVNNGVTLNVVNFTINVQCCYKY